MYPVHGNKPHGLILVSSVPFMLPSVAYFCLFPCTGLATQFIVGSYCVITFASNKDVGLLNIQ